MSLRRSGLGRPTLMKGRVHDDRVVACLDRLRDEVAPEERGFDAGAGKVAACRLQRLMIRFVKIDRRDALAAVDQLGGQDSPSRRRSRRPCPTDPPAALRPEACEPGSIRPCENMPGAVSKRPSISTGGLSRLQFPGNGQAIGGRVKPEGQAMIFRRLPVERDQLAQPLGQAGDAVLLAAGDDHQPAIGRPVRAPRRCRARSRRGGGRTAPAPPRSHRLRHWRRCDALRAAAPGNRAGSPAPATARSRSRRARGSPVRRRGTARGRRLPASTASRPRTDGTGF